MVEDVILKGHLCTHTYSYGDDAENNESAVWFRRRFEWLAIRQIGRF